MKRLLLFIATLLTLAESAGAGSLPARWSSLATDHSVCSPVANLDDFIAEPAMQADILQMLANFTTYMKADFQPCVEPNAIGEACGCFRGENTMGPDERGVRPNADLSMICAFLVKYGKPSSDSQSPALTLPSGVTWANLEQMAMQSLVFAYSTHKANRLKPCAGGRYWGSVSEEDHVWESSLWAMSVAYSAFFQWERLTPVQRGYIYELLKAECNYELERSIPTGYRGDTKAEENGWEADVLAVTLGLYPNDPMASRWFQRLREFAINSYSQQGDAVDTTVVDPDYDGQTVADLFKGQNLYEDYTLQNHNYFHTSYQNVVIQELGEAALALKLFQQELWGEERWHTNALMHNCDRVMTDVLYWLALPDGELAMPNGNDWSLFLYDQITSYSTNACFLRDPHALMLENRAYQMIKARQQTTPDGSWLLRADVGARRMGVEGHRVMMTWLMHHLLPTAPLTPTTWAEFLSEHSCAKVFRSQNIVRAASDQRFVCFSWSEGLKSYTGYLAPFSAEQNNIIVPFRANNTGNFIGWYDVADRRTNAVSVVSGNYQIDGNSFVMNGELLTNDSALTNRFALYATPGNAVVYVDNVRANTDCTILRERGGLMAVSVDEFTRTNRRIHPSPFALHDGPVVVNDPWICIDNSVGIVSSSRQMGWGEKVNNNSINTVSLYALYDNHARTVRQGELVGRRYVVYYSNADSILTQQLARQLTALQTAEGWRGIVAPDPDGTAYLLLTNFEGDAQCRLERVSCPLGSPVFTVPTTITAQGASALFRAEPNHSVANTLRVFITGTDVEAQQAGDDPSTIILRNLSARRNRLTVTTISGGKAVVRRIVLRDTPLLLKAR